MFFFFLFFFPFLSIPATISRVLKYIPELQQQVEGLTKKKEEILLRISHEGDAVISRGPQRKIAHHMSGFVVSTSRLTGSMIWGCYSDFLLYGLQDSTLWDLALFRKWWPCTTKCFFLLWDLWREGLL